MDERIENELEIIREYYSDIEYESEGHWFLIPEYPEMPDEPKWTPQPMPVAFYPRQGYPAQKPYGMFVPADILVDGDEPDNFKPNPNKQPPFDGEWGQLSWQPKEWNPAANVAEGANLLSFALTFKERFREGK